MKPITDLEVGLCIGRHVQITSGFRVSFVCAADVEQARTTLAADDNTTGLALIRDTFWLDESQLSTVARALDPEGCRRDGCAGHVESLDHDGLCAPHHHNDPNED